MVVTITASSLADTTVADRQKGFGLIELVIVVAIAGILATIALPAYQQYVDRGRRQVAIAALTQLLSLQQQERLVRRSFAEEFDVLIGVDSDSLCVDAQRRFLACPDNSALYVVTMDFDANLGGSLTATATGVQVRDTECRRFSLDSAGLQTARTADEENSTVNCWR